MSRIIIGDFERFTHGVEQNIIRTPILDIFDGYFKHDFHFLAASNSQSNAEQKGCLITTFLINFYIFNNYLKGYQLMPDTPN